MGGGGIFSNLIEGIRKFIQKIITTVRAKLSKIGVKSKIDTLKQKLGNKDVRIKGVKGAYRTTADAMRTYNEYVKEHIKFFTMLTKKNFSSAEEMQRYSNMEVKKIDTKYADLISEVNMIGFDGTVKKKIWD